MRFTAEASGSWGTRMRSSSAAFPPSSCDRPRVAAASTSTLSSSGHVDPAHRRTRPADFCGSRRSPARRQIPGPVHSLQGPLERGVTRDLDRLGPRPQHLEALDLVPGNRSHSVEPAVARDQELPSGPAQSAAARTHRRVDHAQGDPRLGRRPGEGRPRIQLGEHQGVGPRTLHRFAAIRHRLEGRVPRVVRGQLTEDTLGGGRRVGDEKLKFRPLRAHPIHHGNRAGQLPRRSTVQPQQGAEWIPVSLGPTRDLAGGGAPALDRGRNLRRSGTESRKQRAAAR